MTENTEVKRFPIYKAGTILNKFVGKINSFDINPIYNKITILYPCRLDAMAINPAAVAYNEKLAFTPGEVTVSIENFIKITIKVLAADGGKLEISKETKRKALVKHAYTLITSVLNIKPSLYIDVNDTSIPKHCGFGSSSSTISSVVAAINELYKKPLDNKDLIKYIASNHGEEIEGDDDNLKSVQSIGGGASSGFLSYGLIIIAGHATPIANIKLPDKKVLVCIPKDFKQQSADYLMKLEEDNMHKFVETGNKYKDIIAYNLLHKAIPDMLNGDIKALSDVVFDYRFNMGSIDNCSFTYPKMVDLAKVLRNLYETEHCDMLALSSVGPAFFTIVSNNDDLKICKDLMLSLDMNVYEYEICNSTYKILERN